MRHLLLGILLIVGGAVSLAIADGVNPAPGAPDLGFVRVDSANHRRVLILLVDSWSDATASDSSVMPNVARLARDGASGSIETVYEGFSIPAIRAAFSGQAETQLLNVIRNFHFRAISTESSFEDAAKVGKRSFAIGYEPLVQFGSVLERSLPDNPALDMYGLDRMRPQMALEAYRSGRYDIVICHLESGDWRAHEVGVNSPKYRAEFSAIDSVAGLFGAELRDGDYLLIFGDHGHNATGEHKTGLDIPTHGVFVGPDVKPAVRFSALPISDMRFIVDHAIGIERRASPSQADRMSRFLPVEGGAVSAAPPARHAWSTRVSDYLMAAVFALALALAFRAVVGAAEREALLTNTNIAVAGAFVLEVVLQYRASPVFSLMPYLLIAFAFAAWLNAKPRAALLLMGVGGYFTWTQALSMQAPALSEPHGMLAAGLTYAFGTAAKYVLLLFVSGCKRRSDVVGVTAALALLEFRVADYPATYLAGIAIALAACWRVSDPSRRRLALAALGFAVLYFTLRLPIYQYAWVDFFLLAAWAASQVMANAWLDALVISGAFALTSLWLPGGLEWGFLYGIFPAYVVENQVGWFTPFILLKIPVLLMLTSWTIGVTHPRRFVALAMVYAGIRLAAVWVMRLYGAGGADVWPMAEQGMYLLTFVAAAVMATRTRTRARA